METKYPHTAGLLSKAAHPIVELFFEYAQLKNIYRKGWLDRNVLREHGESDADHSFSVALLGYIIASEYRPDLDALRVMRLGLFHELGETRAGDVTPYDGVGADEKFQREYDAVKLMFSRFSNPDKYTTLWLEYAKKSSPEARFVKQIDKLEMVLQANLYERIGYTTLDVSEIGH